MLDIKFVRSNPEVVKQNIKNKFQDSKLPLVDEVLELDQKNREIKGEVEALRAEKNKTSNNLCADVANEIFASSIHNIASADDNPTATLIDTPIASIITKSTTITIAV
jgi:seryl-tRNA synthetase